MCVQPLKSVCVCVYVCVCVFIIKCMKHHILCLITIIIAIIFYYKYSSISK